MKEENNATTIVTPKFRVSFPAVWEPKTAPGGKDAKYSVVMLFDTKDPIVAKGLEAMKAAVRAAVVERWGEDSTKWPKGLRMPFRKGEEKDYDGYGPGVVFCSASSLVRPGIVQPWAGPDGKPELLTVPSDFYGGCYARAKLNAFAYPGRGKPDLGNRGVSFGLRSIQKIQDGDPFGGGSGKVENDFMPIDTPAGGESKAEDVGSDPLGL
jgi:hypothetical protein